MSEEMQWSRSPKQKRRWRWYQWLLFLLGLVVLLLIAAGIWAYSAFQPVNGSKKIQLTVQSGESVAALSRDLQQKQIIRSSLLFRVYTRFTHTGVLIRAGRYEFQQGTSLRKLVAQLETGKGLVQEIKVTIPEGYTVAQIASRLQQDGVCSSTAFLHEVQSGAFTEPFLQTLPQNRKLRYRLEGYLFPDTYDFTKGESPHVVVNVMLQTFQNQIQTFAPTMKQQHLSLWKVITEASLVEREAKVEKERPLIASVIDNRLNHKPPMKLQIDATIEYILGHTSIVTDQDLKVKSPYNTYLNYGLPPGPIASPGIKSIEAVLHPAHTQYLYYVVKNNGTGEHYFAKTYTQQLHNEALSQANLKKYS